MLNLAKIGLIDDLKKAVAELPASTSNLDAASVTAIKNLALGELDAITKTDDKINGAALNLKANQIGRWRQVEIQTSGRFIEQK